MTIKILSEKTINRIAAGEVIERPFSVVKELLENSIDAKATKIEIEIIRGGRNLVSVKDNGKGIKKDELNIAIQRHATSKLQEHDINDIKFLGFRGEALPSIASVSNMKIISKAEGNTEAWEINITGGEINSLNPASHNQGTTVEVKDLFFLTPTRLRFLKSERSETTLCVDLVNKLALSYHEISFKLSSNGKEVINVVSQEFPITKDTKRIKAILGEELLNNAVKVNFEKEGVQIQGYVSLPTYQSRTTYSQHFYVNRRLVKDKLLARSLKLAYRNLTHGSYYPAAVLFFTIDPKLVDVNVHPTKSEVRFSDEQLIKSLIIEAVRSAIAGEGLRYSTSSSDQAIALLKKNTNESNTTKKTKNTPISNVLEQHKMLISDKKNFPNDDLSSTQIISDNKENIYLKKIFENDSKQPPEDHSTTYNQFELGMAKCQLDLTYIIAQTQDSLVIVDQHAAHERLVLEKMKKQLSRGKIKAQLLLIPEIIELGQVLTERLLEKTTELKFLGIDLDRNGLSQVIIRKIPAILKNINIKELVKNIAENIHLFEDIGIITEKIEEIYGNIACHSSIRSGRKLNIDEMNALLREMEKIPFSSQCNHGRPTFVKLSFKDIENIFERS